MNAVTLYETDTQVIDLLRSELARLRDNLDRVVEMAATSAEAQEQRFVYEGLASQLTRSLAQLDDVAATLAQQHVDNQAKLQELQDEARESTQKQNRFTLIISAVTLVIGAALSEAANLMIHR